MVSKFFSIVKEEHSKSFIFEYQINWNVEAISGVSNANGFIVQHFSRKSTPSNFAVKDSEYWEAWKVKNGICVDRGNLCDDEFEVFMELADSFRVSLGTSGSYELNGDVYWMPVTSEVYSTIDSWSKTAVREANGLRASYDKPDGIDSYFVFSRPQFIHSWSLLEEAEIKEKILATYLHFCPQYTTTDIDYLTCHLDHIFENQNSDMQYIKEWIFHEWTRTRSNEK